MPRIEDLQNLFWFGVGYVALGLCLGAVYLPLGWGWYAVGVLLSPALGWGMFILYERPVMVTTADGVNAWRSDSALERPAWWWVLVAIAASPYLYSWSREWWPVLAAFVLLLGIGHDQGRLRLLWCAGVCYACAIGVLVYDQVRCRPRLLALLVGGFVFAATVLLWWGIGWVRSRWFAL